MQGNTRLLILASKVIHGYEQSGKKQKNKNLIHLVDIPGKRAGYYKYKNKKHWHGYKCGCKPYAHIGQKLWPVAVIKMDTSKVDTERTMAVGADVIFIIIAGQPLLCKKTQISTKEEAKSFKYK